MLEFVPKITDRGLYFDGALLQALSSELLGSLDDARPKSIMPTYGENWSHRKRWIPVSLTQGHTLTIIEIKRQEGSVPHLEQYVWLVHEVVHFIFSYLAHDPIRKVEETLARILRELAYANLPVRGAAAQAAAITNDLDSYWRPKGDQRNWSHELAVDAICLWVLGPAYVDALYHAYEHPLTPEALYQIEQEHPPVELRLFALLEAARELGWAEECAQLDQRYGTLIAEGVEVGLGNRYAALRRLDLSETVREAAWQYCHSAGLPRLTPDSLVAVRAAMQSPETLTGLKLILAAWLKAKEATAANDVEAFDLWVQELLNLPQYEP